MGIYPIRSEADHKRALGRIGKLMDAGQLTEGEGSELDALVTLVAAYEDKQFPIREATPTEIIEFMMDQRELTRKDLEPMIGTRARVSEVLSGKRPLTLAMIRALSSAWGISADLLIVPSAESTQRPTVLAASARPRRMRARGASCGTCSEKMTNPAVKMF
jgi:HTH-type transcriptional regulator/antitoxin HigA